VLAIRPEREEEQENDQKQAKGLQILKNFFNNLILNEANKFSTLLKQRPVTSNAPVLR